MLKIRFTFTEEDAKKVQNIAVWNAPANGLSNTMLILLS